MTDFTRGVVTGIAIAAPVAGSLGLLVASWLAATRDALRSSIDTANTESRTTPEAR